MVLTIPFVFPGVDGVRCAFQVRSLPSNPFGGNIAFTVGDDPAAVFANRKALAQSLQLSSIAELNQIHSDIMVFDPVPAPLDATLEPPLFPDGDGLATTQPGLGLMIKSADCQPVFIVHEKGKHIAALHIGWKGNRAGFLQSAVASFCARYDLRPSELLAVRGPGLGPAQSEFINYTNEWGGDFIRWYDSRTRTVNLWELTRAQLLAAGLASERLFSLDLCTASLPELFFSFRRDKVCGRQGSLVWIEE